MKSEDIIYQLVKSGLENDRAAIETVALTAIRLLRKTNPEVAQQLSNLLAYSGVGASPIRAIGLNEPPVDAETQSGLAVVELDPNVSVTPVFSEELEVELAQFLKERESAPKLLESGILPPRSLLLTGPPGVGKTLLASIIAARLGKPLITLDLASSISSYLGKTGQNLHKVLEYARSNSSVLLLDEFDAIAKRRDDPSDLGELKRIVNVLLKELEQWPAFSVFIAATNHPDLLDKAIWRRFDRVLELKLPDALDRAKLFSSYFTDFISPLPTVVATALGAVSEGLSPADIAKISDRVKRRVILDGGDLISVCFDETLKLGGVEEHNRGAIIRMCAEALGKKISQRELARWLGISHSTVVYHLKKGGCVDAK